MAAGRGGVDPRKPLSLRRFGRIAVPASPWSWKTRFLFLVMVCVWGMNYLFVNVGLAYASSLWLASLRSSIGALAVVALMTPLHSWGQLDSRGRRDALILGLPNTTFFFGLWFIAARTVLPGIAATLIYTFPLWVALLSAPVLGHRLRGRHWVSVVVGFVGVALVSEAWMIVTASSSPVAVLELLGAAISWAVGTVVFQRRFHRTQMLEANAFQLIGGSVGILALTLLFAPLPLPSVTPVLVGTALWLGVVGTAVAYTIWFNLLGRTRAATVSAYLFLVPVVALTASAFFFGERLAPLQVLGVGLVLLSIYGVGRTPVPEPLSSDAVPPPPE